MNGGRKSELLARRGGAFERLESRALLAAVSWDGGAGDSLWNSAANWSNDVVPGAADDVTIDVAANPTIRFLATDRTINSLVTKENLQFEGATLTVNTTAAVAGPRIFMQGGSLRGGTWSFTGAGTFVTTASGGTLTDVVMGTELRLSSTNARVTLAGATTFTATRLTGSGVVLSLSTGMSLNSPVTAEGSTAGSRTINVGSTPGAFTVGPLASLKVVAGAGGGLTINLASEINLINDGLISSEAAGQTLALSGADLATITNSSLGTVQALAGNLSFGAGSWTNSGTLKVASGGTLQLTGTLNAAAGWGSVLNTGGTLNLVGTINNTGNTIALNSSSGSLALFGGKVVGGSISYADGARLVPTPTGGTLKDVAVGGELLLDAASASVTLDGNTTFAAARLSVGGASLKFVTGATLNSPVIVEGAATGVRTLALDLQPGSLVTFGPAALVKLAAGAGGGLDVNFVSLINQGQISSEASGQTLSLSGASFTNAATGSLQALAGALDIKPTNWSTLGLLHVASGATATFRGVLDTSSGIGTIENLSANPISVVGTIANTGNTITLNSTTGSLVLSGGKIRGGSVALLDGQRLRTTSAGSTLEDVAIDGEVLMSTNSSSLIVLGTTTFSVLRIAGNATSLRLGVGFVLNSLVSIEGISGTQAVVSFNYGAVVDGDTATIGPTGIIRLAAGSGIGVRIGTARPGSLVNLGLISNEAAGQTLTIEATHFTNGATGVVQALAGTVDVTSTSMTGLASGAFGAGAGATLRFGATNWTNAGTININNATLVLAGAVSTSNFNFAGFTRTNGGEVKLTGTIANAGSTIQLNSATGSWTLAGGTIVGGSVSCADGTSMLTSSAGGTLTDVSVAGELLFDTMNAVASLGGTTTFAALRLAASGASVTLAAGFVLDSLISVEGAATGDRKILLTTSVNPVTIGPSAVVRIASSSGGGLVIGSGSGGLVSSGLISNEAANLDLTFKTGTLTNAGTIQALAGQVLLQSTSWTSSGVIRAASQGSLLLGGVWNTAGDIGTLLNTGAGTISLTGTIANSGNTFALNAATGSLRLAGGSISGGAISFADGAALVPTSTPTLLANVAIAGELVLETTGASITVSGTTTFTHARLSGNGATITFAVGYTLNSLVSVDAGPTSACSVIWSNGGTSGTWTIGPTGVIRLAAGATGGLNVAIATGTLTNNGLITNEAAGRTLAISGSITNSATIQVLAGTMTLTGFTLTNQASGVILAAPGSALRLQIVLKNFGICFINDATITLAGALTPSSLNAARITRTAGSVLNLAGTLDNTGNTLTLDAETGSWNLLGGAIKGGVISFGDGATLVPTSSGGTLTDVQIDGELLFNSTDARVTLVGTTTFAAARLSAGGASIFMATGYTLNTLISVEGSLASTCFIYLAVGWPGAVTFGPSAVVRIAPNAASGLTISNSSGATLVNRGLIQGQAVGQQLLINCSTFSNAGVVDGAGSDIVIASPTITNFVLGTVAGGIWKASTGGSISGGAQANIKTLNATVVLDGASKGWDALGTLELIPAGGLLQISGGTDQTLTPLSGTFTNSGTLILGLGSSLVIAGNFVQTSSATLTAQIAGADPNTGYGYISASGIGILGGTLNIIAMNGYDPSRPDTQDIIQTASGSSGVFNAVTFPQTSNPEWKTVLVSTGLGVRLLTTSIIDLNSDGQVDLEDFFGFFNRWDTFDQSLDLNHDGTVDLGDYFLFFNLWSQS